MQVHIAADYEHLCHEAASYIARTVLRLPCCSLALPTGQTPVGVYRILAQWTDEGLLDFSGVVVFNLDEYYGLRTDDPRRFRSFLEKHLLHTVQVRNAFSPNSMAPDPEFECRRYDALIAENGGIDLAVLGLGVNAHVAFNEPGTPWEATTHIADLSKDTRSRATEQFGGFDQVPRRAITMGIRTIMNARTVLLLASGPEKSDAVVRTLLGPVTQQVPASALQLHPRLSVFLDRAAAACLSEAGQTPDLSITL